MEEAERLLEAVERVREVNIREVTFRSGDVNKASGDDSESGEAEGTTALGTPGSCKAEEVQVEQHIRLNTSG